MDIWVISTFWLLWITMPSMLMCNFLCENYFFNSQLKNKIIRMVDYLEITGYEILHIETHKLWPKQFSKYKLQS